MVHLSDLFEHNLWANLALLDTCAQLGDEQLDAVVPGTYGSVRATLLHLAGAERRYMQRLRREERSPFATEFPGFDALRASLIETGEALATLAEELDGSEQVDGDFGGRTWRVENRVVFVQAINHGTEHRAHILTTITANGGEGVDIDGWSWAEATGAMRALD